MVSYGKLKPGVVVSVVLVRSSDVCRVLKLELPPPMRSVPAGLCQDTCMSRSSDREYDCSHSPLKLWQVVRVSVVAPPPHTVKEDCVCADRPGAGRSGSLQLRPPGSHTSAEVLGSPSPAPPPVSSSAENITSSII